MVFKDSRLNCAECDSWFVFTGRDQVYHLEKGYTAPKRCPSCREVRRGRVKSDAPVKTAPESDRPMYPAVCAECGNETQVPFEPKLERPVYCFECYQAKRPGASAETES